MALKEVKSMQLNDRDLDFLIEAAVEMDLSDTFWVLHENFQKAQKPLNYIVEHYLPFKSNVFLI